MLFVSLAVALLAVVPLADGAPQVVYATGVIAGTGGAYTLTITATSDEPVRCFAPLVPPGTTLVSGQGPAGEKLAFVCRGPCTKSVSQRFEIKMLAREQLRVLFGRTLAYTVKTKCGATTKVVRVRVSINQNGKLRPLS